jgi:hypothetical protein
MISEAFMKILKRLTANVSVIALLAALGSPIALAQTQVKAPGNPIDINKDVELGRQAAAEAERQLPLMNDPEIEEYVDSVGNRLVAAIPSQYRHPQFRYSFKVVNARDINAFALPGGFTYVNRGLIEAAKTEGELAGVMAHEISHVALRHGTAQYAKAQKFGIGAAAGQILGAIIGGALGGVIAQGSQFGIGAYFLKYGRDYERQADILGAQIMANAGYDPRELANMFRTIERESGRGGPEWLSSHPNPGNRYEAINREAQMLNVREGYNDNRAFLNIQSRLRGQPRARSMEEIARGNQRYPQDGGRVSSRVEYPSTRYRSYTAGNVFRLQVPDNWRELPSDNSVTFAPVGAYGEAGGRFIFTHGVMAGLERAQSNNLRQATDYFVNALAQGNPSIRRQGGYQRGTIDGREALSVSFTNYSDVTGRSEYVTVYTTLLGNGELFYMVAVAPQDEYRNYQRAFQNVLSSVQLSGR